MPGSKTKFAWIRPGGGVNYVLYSGTAASPVGDWLSTTHGGSITAVEGVENVDGYTLESPPGLEPEDNPLASALLGRSVRGSVYVYTKPGTKAGIRKMVEDVARRQSAQATRLRREKKVLLSKIKKGVKRPRRPYDFFASDYQRHHRRQKDEQTFRDLIQRCHQAWAGLDVTGRARYEQRSKQDALRYQMDLDEFHRKYPRPVTKPRSARSFFNDYVKRQRALNVTAIPTWKDAPSDVRAMCQKQNEESMAVYHADQQRLQQFCSEHHLEEVELMSAFRKRRAKRRRTDVVTNV